MTADRPPADVPASSDSDGVWTCPTCSARSPRHAPERPFCSARCRLLDLGRWFNGEYAVPGESAIAIEGLEESFPLPPAPGREGANDERDA